MKVWTPKRLQLSLQQAPVLQLLKGGMRTAKAWAVVGEVIKCYESGIRLVCQALCTVTTERGLQWVVKITAGGWLCGTHQCCSDNYLEELCSEWHTPQS